MTTLVEHIIVAGVKNRPSMLEKSMYDSWKSRIQQFIKGKKHGRMMLDSIDNGPLVYLTIEEDGHTRLKKYLELTEAQQLQDDCDVQETNIILHGLPPDVYALQVQVNTKFLNALPPEWSKFVTDVKLAKSLYTTNYDQLYAYLSQHKRHAQEVHVLCKRYLDPLALQGEDPIDYINKAMAFLSVVASSFPPSNNQLRTSSNPKNQILDKEQLAFIADPGITEVQVAQQTIPKNSAFQTEDLDAYDSDFDDISSAKAVLMANLLSCDSDVLSEVPYSNTYLNDMINQEVQEMSYSEQTHIVDFPNNEITSDSNIIPYSQYLQKSQYTSTQDTNSSAPNDLLVLSLVK
ncbi:hypothetical protein Tco_0901518 [Tanacetum coccineum]